VGLDLGFQFLLLLAGEQIQVDDLILEYFDHHDAVNRVVWAWEATQSEGMEWMSLDRKPELTAGPRILGMMSKAAASRDMAPPGPPYLTPDKVLILSTFEHLRQNGPMTGSSRSRTAAGYR
jgi:hypothetical protein